MSARQGCLACICSLPRPPCTAPPHPTAPQTPSSPAHPHRSYTKLNVLAAAHRKHGSLQAIQARATALKATADKRKATLAGGEEERRCGR